MRALFQGLLVGFGVGLITWGIARGIENPKKLFFIPSGISMLILAHFYSKRVEGKGLNLGWLFWWRRR